MDHWILSKSLGTNSFEVDIRELLIYTLSLDGTIDPTIVRLLLQHSADLNYFEPGYNTTLGEFIDGLSSGRINQDTESLLDICLAFLEYGVDLTQRGSNLEDKLKYYVSEQG